MRPLLHIARRLLKAEPVAFLRGLALGITVLAMGAALLGLSGWFVTAAAAAGIAGIGIGFDFFRPSAGVRFLALGRSGARYGERMLTHDATLRALAALRLGLYAGITRLPFEAQTRLRGAEALNRLTSDVDALDGLLLRLVLPAVSAVAVQAGAFVALWVLVAPAVAWGVLLSFGLGGGVALVFTLRHARARSEATEAALQSLRAQALDLAQSRADLAVAGALARQEAGLANTIRAEARARDGLETTERQGSAAIALTTGLAATVALALGGPLAAAGTISPARAAIGVFTALALGETLALLRRGLAELGRMQAAGARVTALSDTPPRPKPAAPAPRPDRAAPLLQVTALRHHRAGAARDTFGPLDLSLSRGEMVLLTGPSGAGKSTLLATLAGLIAPTAGEIRLLGAPLAAWPEADLRAHLTLVPQRSALIAGSVAENLALALPAGTVLPEAEAWAALEAVALADVLRAREGLATRLGPGGAGLSGGQARRLVLARAALRRADVLLLDEPTEGLDPATAAAMLSGLRAFAPESGFLVVSHRNADAGAATRSVSLTVPGHA
ncbi:thiol reductant ABC exporter subunit CydC [Paenirhodobacter hankyongi]|uniref:Thiol reductant ABC exporter subunit CydC n=1 Tax=Paenirhodobacter hankyongi TaxID=2294033 RepID=A0A421BJU0_9RHOB|nr:thiol reductant ABC exporter subunit CydC [Sinirhodobacter hankyongi]RLL62702.1 thiol reductant ABC exporter subunit CydC [Sinirhodobacter hankyongi]